MSDEFENMTVAQLKDVLRERGLPVSGKKAELVARLMEESESPNVEDQSIVEFPLKFQKLIMSTYVRREIR